MWCRKWRLSIKASRFYPLGNFIFDQYFSKETQEGIKVGLIIADDGKITSNVFPFFSKKISRYSWCLESGGEQIYGMVWKGMTKQPKPNKQISPAYPVCLLIGRQQSRYKLRKLKIWVDIQSGIISKAGKGKQDAPRSGQISTKVSKLITLAAKSGGRLDF